MTIYETDLPGVGKKFEMDLDGGRRLVVLIHHGGKREVYLRPSEDADSEKLFTLSDQQARRLGSILEGAHFQPVELDQVEVPLGEAIIEWVDVGATSPVAGRTLAEANIREQTGVSVMAVQRDEETVANPDPDLEIRTDDILVALGTRAELQALEAMVEEPADGSASTSDSE